ncbi:TPA: DEAD/DEAH box helicase family protein [Bacillus paranthracis]|uniref:DEAD/DEAH box helicase n=1 Tax=Bacillus cereus group sp. MYBK101-2 TaxID=3450700 RepID=UPI0032F11904|nr:DEAD/DEAH box helicase family protein [Bacillus paranthracis]
MVNTNEEKSGKNRFSGYQIKGKFQSPKVLIDSWKEGIRETVARDDSEVGLRAPQFGALCAMRSHWTVSNSAATIVMPTGTGKTETMLATIVTERISKTLIVVPSDLLRSQIYEKAKGFGILYSIGMLDNSVLPPNVFLYGQGIKDPKEFKRRIKEANIIVTTMALASRMSKEYLSFLSETIDVLFVDEAHHISSKTWSTFKSHFSNSKIMQFTATPFREDGKKVDGTILYNFPLRLAQKQGYFKKIEFVPIEEFDEKKNDKSIAEKAIEILEQDIKQGYQHILLVRANTVERAQELYEKIYIKFYRRYNPVLVTNIQSAKEIKENIQALRDCSAKIVVCVDMFGEGIDIPNLKIAAIHDKYKSIPITLQFIGRFARSKEGLGTAKLITNVADEDIADALQDLYEKDADWNHLLSRKSNEYIDREIELQKFIGGFNIMSVEDINLIHMKPKVSMRAYHVKDSRWNWRNWEKEFNSDICKCFINEDEKVLVIVEPREVGVRWTTQQNLNDIQWNFYVIYWNVHKKVAFLNASDVSKGYRLLKSIFPSGVNIIKSEQVFKCLHGINRLSLGTVGLNSGIDGPVRYKMFAGIDIADGIAESNKINCYKSNIFGNGYDGNGKTSIGCSYKGTIWSRWIESIDYWKEWCDKILEKLLNPSIDVKDIMEGVLIPKVIKSIPQRHPYRIDWPDDLEFETERKIVLSNISGEYNICDVAITLDEVQLVKDKIYFSVKNEFFNEKLYLQIEGDQFVFHSEGDVTTEIRFGNKSSILLTDYFNENPPTIWFVNGDSIQGNILIGLQKDRVTKFPSNSIYSWDWDALKVNIQVESQYKNGTYSKRKNSIQYNVIKELDKTGNYSIIFDDDDAGEIADIVTIAERDKSVQIKFFHCKYAHGKNAGKRVNDLYEVCGQADKSVFWKQNIIGMIERMIYRERERIKKNRPSRFEKGDVLTLNKIRNKLLIQPAELQIIIVQPGVKGTELTNDMHSILSTSYSYCMDTFSVPLKLICT